ncbi:hypothetical protein ABGB12_07940 [Actinocorallia sp. B10E7]|uniref:hypothetical protein n=1 Tax=Actinocorallia sp. B10E7 TaxID=3153558 RepID=UPI00325E4AD6
MTAPPAPNRTGQDRAAAPPPVRRRPPAQRPPAPSPVVAPQRPPTGRHSTAAPRRPVSDDPGRTTADDPGRTVADGTGRTVQDFGRPASDRRGPGPRQVRRRGERPPPVSRPEPRPRPPRGGRRGSRPNGLLWFLSWSSLISVVCLLTVEVKSDESFLWAWPIVGLLVLAFLFCSARSGSAAPPRPRGSGTKR